MIGYEMMKDVLEQLHLLLDKFIKGENQSLNFAEEIEGTIAENYPDDERFNELLDVLASYRPGGGEFLFDESRVVQECKNVVKLLWGNGCCKKIKNI
jgi:hypothetical protein